MTAGRRWIEFGRTARGKVEGRYLPSMYQIWMSRWNVDSPLFCVYVTVEEVAGGTAERRRKESVELKPRGKHVRAAS